MSRGSGTRRGVWGRDGRGRFSVVIPTLQRSEDLWAIVNQCAAHSRVLEVLVVNNAPTPLVWESPKVRVLQQQRNIYVNPAWNLGAREARGDFLAIVNDDVRFDDAAFDLAARGLRWFGVVGPDRSCFSLAQERGASPAPGSTLGDAARLRHLHVHAAGELPARS